jgi:hypothetical protein
MCLYKLVEDTDHSNKTYYGICTFTNYNPEKFYNIGPLQVLYLQDKSQTTWAIRICKLQKIDRFHSKLVSFLLSVTNTQAPKESIMFL